MLGVAGAGAKPQSFFTAIYEWMQRIQQIIWEIVSDTQRPRVYGAFSGDSGHDLALGGWKGGG